MNWFVVLPAAWFGIALALGLLIGRCVRMEDRALPAMQVPEDSTAAPTAMDAPAPAAASRSAGSRDQTFAHTG